MKRIISACLEQTIRFDTYNEADPKADFARYEVQMKQKGCRYQILSQEIQEDGALVVHLKKQYNQYPTTGFLA